MRRIVALVVFGAISWSQVVALRCDMGTVARGADHHAAAMAPSSLHSQQPTAPHGQQPAEPHGQQPAEPHGQQPAEPHGRQPAAPHGQQPATPHGQHHGDSEGCLMMPACGAASSLRPARTVAMMRIPAVFVDAGSHFTTIPVAADLAVEPPPPRHAA